MKKIILVSLTVLIFLACQENNKNTIPTTKEDTHKVEEAHHHATGETPLYLNDGKPWRINEEMKPYLTKSEEVLKTYNNNENDTDYESMSLILKEQNNLLIKSCTMTGEAHDVLHEWLMPHLKLTEALEKAKGQKEADKIIHKLNDSFEDFSEYFE